MSKYMELALAEARIAFSKGEVPIGAVIVKDDKVIAKAHNLKEEKQSAVAHAEILCIDEASKVLGTWHLDDCELYVTIEPCAMCSGAIINSRIKKVYYGASEAKFGAHNSVVNVLGNDKFNHLVEVESGILSEEAAGLMKSFFKLLRK